MKKINHFTFDDILKRRTINSFNKQSDKNNKNNKNQFNQQEQEYGFNQSQLLMNVFEEFKGKDKKYVPNFSVETKTSLIEFISKKLNLKLNTSKIVNKMKIKKIQNIQILDKPHTNHNLALKKKDSLNPMTQSKRLQTSHSIDSKHFHVNKKCSYFVLSGNLHVYQKDNQLRKKSFYQQQNSNQIEFYNWKQFQLQYPIYKRKKTYSQFTGCGLIFANKTQQFKELPQQKQFIFIRQNTSQPSHKIHQLTLAEDSIFIEIQNPQYQDQYINQAGMELQKIAQTIQAFSIFKTLGKKIRNYAQFFELKQYQRNQQVYTIGDRVDKFYLLIKGQIVFQTNNTNPIKSPLGSPKQSRKNSIHIQMNIKTQTVSSGNYFGQEQIILKIQERLLTAKCKSSKCQILQIPKQKFQKMLQYSDFYQSVKKSAEVKFKQRLSKLQKNKQIRTKFTLAQFNQQKSQQMSNTQRVQDFKTVPFFGTPKKSIDGRFKVMHGNIIRQFSKQQKSKMTEDVYFSMLKVNPDMYDKTVDKFRKYNVKPKEKYVPQVNWQLKRVWKVLNLENVLRQEAEVTSPQGRKFYDSHKRYVYHIRQSKSLRPKTSSSTYRTKLQYIAYLQQFKGDK